MRNPNRNLNRCLLSQADMHKARMRGHGKPIYRGVMLFNYRIAKVQVFNRVPIGEAK